MEKTLIPARYRARRVLRLCSAMFALMLASWAMASHANARECRINVAALFPDIESAREILGSFRDELTEDVCVSELIVDNSTTPNNLQEVFAKIDPRAIVLLNNTSVHLYRAYQEAHPEQNFPPAIVAMTSFLSLEIPGLKNVTGIHYEVPAFTGLRELRASVTNPIKRIGVVYRARFRDFIERQREFLEPNGFELVSIEVSSQGRELRRELNRALRQLLRYDDVDAIWLPNDNALLTPDLLATGWMPRLKEDAKPLVVGVRSLVSKDIELGMFAVLPDHTAMGATIAELLLELEESQWRTDGFEPMEPVSIKKVLNLQVASELLNVKTEKLEEFDEVLR